MAAAKPKTGKTPTGIPVRRRFAYRRPEELGREYIRRVPLVVVGGGPVGLSAALDLARRHHEVIILNRLDILAGGSRAICWSKRTLDIFDRLGTGEKLVEMGQQWHIGKVFVGDAEQPCYQFDLLPLKQQKNPAFINLQQYHVEECLIESVLADDKIDLRWGQEVVAVEKLADGARLSIATPDGAYQLDAEYVLACDGGKSPLRTLLGLDFEGRVFEDNFLIADIKMKQERPAERWFWFDPPFPGDSTLLHKQADDVWRCDFQLGRDIDKQAAIEPKNAEPFVRGMLGEVDFSFEWLSVYTFQCRRMARFVHDRIIFLGDAAHLVSPFGARGGNGGIADVDNLGWKLDLILRGDAPPDLLESYNEEATFMADENILTCMRTSDFITPKNAFSRAFRDGVLELARDYDFARSLVNSGRLSTPVPCPNSSLNAPDSDDFRGGIAPGYVCADAPVETSTGAGWLLSALGGGFTMLIFAGHAAESRPAVAGIKRVVVLPKGCRAQPGSVIDQDGLVAERFGAGTGDVYIIRPDQYVAGRWHNPSDKQIIAACQRATGAKKQPQKPR